MKIFNTLTKEIEDLVPLQNSKIGIYSCGPTVYDNLHIGNLSSFIYADLLRRVLEKSGNEVQHVMNVTDIDDKTIRKSQSEYPDDEPSSALKKTTDHYKQVFLDDLTSTGNDVAAITFISAVDSINDMINLIQKIIDYDIGYLADDGIYFSISKYQEAGNSYGVLQAVEISKSQSRIANDEYDKESANDFALWKKAQEGEPSWQASFNINGQQITMQGRPGWHIECSAMSQKTLGTPFDIHTGGIDLKFPHHENEIAQTCASGESGLANYFFHNAHILVDGRKMSKSLGNIYTLRDLEDKGFDSNAFRMLVLESHYRKESNFSWEILTAAQNRLKHWQATADLVWQVSDDSSTESAIIDTEKVLSRLQDDLDTPGALTAIDQTIDTIEKSNLASLNSDALRNYFDFLETTLGLKLIGNDLTSDQKDLLQQRSQARTAKDWSKSDEIRDTLASQSVGLRDVGDKTIWHRI